MLNTQKDRIMKAREKDLIAKRKTAMKFFKKETKKILADFRTQYIKGVNPSDLSATHVCTEVEVVSDELFSKMEKFVHKKGFHIRMDTQIPYNTSIVISWFKQ